MNPFSIIWMFFFASYCSSQDELSKSATNIDFENTTRCDTYLYNQTHEIAYTWAIQNFSLYEKDSNGQIFSPKLHAPTDNRFTWDIKIIPNGIDGKNTTISLYVFLCDIRNVTTNIDIAIINHKNETLLSVSKSSEKIGGSYGPMAWTNFCKKDDSFRNQMLQNDTLTLSINIRWFPESPYVTVRNISDGNKTNSSSPIPETTIIKCNLLENLEWIRTNPKIADMIFSSNGSYCRCDGMPVQVHEIKYIWAIHNFSVHQTLGYREIFSPYMQASTTDKYIWYIKLTPNGHHNDYGIRTMKPIGLDVYLSKQSNATNAFAKFAISIINREKRVLFHESAPITLKAGNSEYWQNFCAKSASFKDIFLNNDALTLFIRIKWISEPCNVSVSHQHNTSTSSPAETPDPVDVSCNLSQILESMLENPKFADVVFTTNGSSYPAHQAVLAARSPVFATMFQEKYAKHGNKTTRIRINFAPMGEEVLRAMLRYIYTGKCENFSELADKLFITAVKYGLDGLRNVCEQTLCQTVSAENAAAMLEFAKQHQAEELKSKATEFIENVSNQKSNTTIH